MYNLGVSSCICTALCIASATTASASSTVKGHSNMSLPRKASVEIGYQIAALITADSN